MRKAFLASLLLLITGLLLYTMVNTTLQADREVMDWVNRVYEDRRIPGSNARLSPEEKSAVHEQALSDIARLESLRSHLQPVLAVLLGILTLLLIRSDYRLRSFDGLALLLATLLTYGVHELLMEFAEGYDHGPNATLNLRIGITSGLIVLNPVFFYLAARWNKAEVRHQLHRQAWITVVGFTLAVLSGLAALALGIGLLMTPDLSGNIT